MALAVAGLLCLLVTGVFFLSILKVGRRDPRLPPGPQTMPLLGNIHQIPQSSPHYRFTHWAQQYGGIFSLKLGRGTVIVLTDPRLVKQLLDKKGAIYSDRPKSYIGNELIARGHHVLLMHYSDQWRQFRRLMQRQFNEARVESEHVPLIEAEAIQLLCDLMNRPDMVHWHPKRFSNSVAMALIYGIRTRDSNTAHMRDLYDIIDMWSRIMETGATPPVDLLPWLKYFPERLWNGWKTRAEEVQNKMDILYEELANRVRRRRENGVRTGCLMDRVLDLEPEVQLEAHELSFFGGTILEGGSDTTSSMMLAFIQAMLKFPHVQMKAHREIDDSIEQGRSPTWSDMSRLPYVIQIVKETMRWRPVTPLSVPHATTADDEIDGYRIPKGSTVIVNVWGLHNLKGEKGFPATDFIPERFEGFTKLAPEYAVSADYENRDHYGYGAGRRLCPGIHVAERNLVIAIAKLLWAFEFREKPGHEVDIDPRSGYSEGFLHCAKPFECEILVREGRKEIIVKESEMVGELLGQYE